MENKERIQIIANNITKYRKEKGLTQSELAKAIGITPSTMTDYMKLRSAPSFGVIQKLADFFGVLKSDIDTTFKDTSPTSTLTLITETSSKLDEVRQEEVLEFAEEKLEEQENENRKVINLSEIRELYEDYQTQKEEVKVYGGVSAGTGLDLYDEVIETIKYPKPIPSHDIALRVIGDSMTPLFQDGELIFIKKTQEIHNGQIGVFIVNGQGFVKKIMKGVDSVKLISLNKKYDDIILTEYDDVHTVGIVVF